MKNEILTEVGQEDLNNQPIPQSIPNALGDKNAEQDPNKDQEQDPNQEEEQKKEPEKKKGDNPQAKAFKNNMVAAFNNIKRLSETPDFKDPNKRKNIALQIAGILSIQSLGKGIDLPELAKAPKINMTKVNQVMSKKPEDQAIMKNAEFIQQYIDEYTKENDANEKMSYMNAIFHSGLKEKELQQVFNYIMSSNRAYGPIIQKIMKEYETSNNHPVKK